MKLVVFACVHNAGRSQMAAALFDKLADPTKAKAISAGTQPADHVHPIVMGAMTEVGIDLSNVVPQLLADEIVAKASFLITMGCGEQCPVAPPSVRRLDWELEDPKGQPIERVRQIRDDIKLRVIQLIEANHWQP